MALTRARYSQIFDTDYKQSVRLATTTNVGNLLISGNVLSSIDGVTVSVNDRILVKDQTDAKQNGIYRVVTVGSGTDGTWVRAQDADNVGNGKVTSGMTTTVTEGSTNASKTFKLSTPDPIVVGTTELTFVNPFAASVGGANTAVQFNDAGSIGGSTAFVFNKYSNVLTISGNVSAGNILTSNILYPNGSPYLIGGGTVSISSSNTAPVSPTVGDFWYDTSEDILFQYIDDGTNQVWIDLSGDPAQVVTGTPNKQFYANKVQVGTSQYLLDTFPAAGNTLVTWTVSAKDNIGNNIRSSTIHSVNDGTDVYWTEYGIIQSNSSVNVATFTSNISSGNIRLYTTGDSANVSITFQRLLLGSDTTTGYIMGGTAGPAGPTGTVSNTSGIIKTTNTTVSTSATTGALQVAGGAGIGGNVYIQSGNQFNIGADLANLTLTGNVLSIDLSPMHVFSNADANNRIIVQNVNSGSNASSGMTFVADNGDINNNFFDIGLNNSTNDDGILYRNDGFLHVIGGNIMMGALSLSKNIHFHVGDMTTEDHMVGMFDANSFHVMKSTVSSSTTTGALRVHGGAGIEGNVYVGNITATYLYGNGSQLTGITSDATKIESGTSNVKSLSSSNVTVSVAGTSNVAVFTTDNIEIAGNLIPSANVTYNLGSSTRRWNVGYFAANTIDLGGSTIGAGANGFVMTPAGGSEMMFNSNGSMSGTLLTAAQPNITQVGQLANLTVGGNLTVSGNLTVNGNVTTINANNLTINDSLIYLAEENPADTLDIGITAHVVNPSLNHVGFVRDASDGVWKLFSNVATQPTTTVDFTGARYANLQIGNLIASSIVISGTIDSSSSTGCTLGGVTLSGGTIFRNGGETIVYGGGAQNTRAQLRLGNSQGTVLYGKGTAAAPNLPNSGIIIHGGDGNVQIRAPNVASGGSRIQLQAELVEVQGNLTPVGNLLYSIGNVTNQWNTVFANTVQASGNISTAGYFLGNAALLTGLPSSYGNTQVASYLPTYSGVLGTSNLQVTGGGTFTGTLTVGASGWIYSGGNVISGGNMQDSKGDVRAAPINSQMMSYTATATDAGKAIVMSMLNTNVTFNASVFASGDMVSVVNTSGSSISLVQGTNVTLRLAGTSTTGSRTLASNGVATLICTTGGGAPTFYCSGAGLT